MKITKREKALITMCLRAIAGFQPALSEELQSLAFRIEHELKEMNEAQEAAQIAGVYDE